MQNVIADLALEVEHEVDQLSRRRMLGGRQPVLERQDPLGALIASDMR